MISKNYVYPSKTNDILASQPSYVAARTGEEVRRGIALLRDASTVKL